MALHLLTDVLPFLKAIGILVTLVKMVHYIDVFLENEFWDYIEAQFGEEALLGRKDRLLIAICIVLGGFVTPSLFRYIIQLYSFIFLISEVLLIVAGGGTTLYVLFKGFLWLIGLFEYN
jgi:hypothetical protein